MELTFGQALPDQLSRVQAITSEQIGFLLDVREYMKERVALERHYGTTLQGIVKRASEKRARKEQAMGVGMDPSKLWTGGTANSLDEAWSKILSEADEEASDHANLADQLQKEICDALKVVHKKKEATSRKHSEFGSRVIDDRDKVYADKDKAKKHYDEACAAVEASRARQERAHDDKSQAKSAHSMDKHITEMQSSKNAYLIHLVLATQAKERFYRADLPCLHNDFQGLWSVATSRLVTLLRKMTTLSDEYHERLKSHNAHSVSAIESVSVSEDHKLFIEYNKRHFVEPPGFTFEPCTFWHDSSDFLISDAVPKTLLQNRLATDRAKLAELGPQIDAKTKEVEGLKNLRQAYAENEALGDVDDVMDGLLESERRLMVLEGQRTLLTGEIGLLEETLGDDQGSQQPHTFKPTSFVTPTPCNLCSNSIWGLTKQGATCKTCGFNVHVKCQPKVPSDCPGTAPPAGRKRATSVTSGGPTYLQSYISPTSAPPMTASQSNLRRAATTSATAPHAAPSHVEDPPPPVFVGATALYSYQARTAHELDISELQTLTILEGDDGSGWSKVEASTGQVGLVPSSYLQLDAPPAAEQRPPPIPARIPRVKQVKVLYEWNAQAEDEISVKPGEILPLTAKGEDYSEGWYEVQKDGKVGIVPSNYVEMMA